MKESNIYSIFDYLYKQYTQTREEYFQKHKRISMFDSENLMYHLITKILKEQNYSSLDVLWQYKLRMLIKNLDILSKEERKYVTNEATHIDFLIYNRVIKKPVLAIEVDGYFYHNNDTVKKRDNMKNHILKLYGIPLVRFGTHESDEKEKLIQKLTELML